MVYYWWQPDALPIFSWWVAVTLLGWLSYPLAYRCAAMLPDRGLGLAKIMGLALPTLGYALLSNGKDLSNNFGSTAIPKGLAAAIVFWAIINLMLLRRSWRLIALFLRSHWKIPISYEIAFLLCFLLYLWFRSYIPDATFDTLGWYGAEKWDNLAILTSLWRNPSIPPADPWLSGYSLNYYYFSHLIWALMARLTGTAPEVAFNLGLGTLFALLVTLCFSSGWAFSERKCGGFWAFLLVSAGGSLATWDQLPAMLEAFRRGFSEAIGAKLPISSAIGEATRGFFGAFSLWLPSDVIPNTRNEFPAFNWLLGDLHAHGTGLLFLLAAISLLLQIQRMRQMQGGRWFETVVSHPSPWIVLGCFCGAMWAANSWDLLVATLVGFLLVVVVSKDDGFPAQCLSQIFQGALLWSLLLCAAVLFLTSFYTAHTYPPLRIHHTWLANMPGPLAMLGSLGFVEPAWRTTPMQWVSFWGFFLVAIATLVALRLLEQSFFRAEQNRRLLEAKSGWNSPLLAFCAISLALFLFAYQYRHSNTMLIWAILSGIACCVFHLVKHPFHSTAQWSVLFFLVALILQIIPEYLYIDDPIDGDNQRYNTVFKLYYPAWALAGLGLSILLSSLRWQWPLPGAASQLTNLANPFPSFLETASEFKQTQEHCDLPRWLIRGAGLAHGIIAFALIAILVIGTGAYSLFGVGERICDAKLRMQELRDAGWDEALLRSKCRGLNGLAFMGLPKYDAEDDLRLGLWMRAHLPAATQIAEATGPSYTMSGRFSVISGIPSYLGWLQHQTQWRGERVFQPILMSRNPALETIYRSASAEDALLVCRQYDLRYVAVGKIERMRYPRERLEKLGRIGHVLARFGDSVLYELDFGDTNRIQTEPLLDKDRPFLKNKQSRLEEKASDCYCGLLHGKA